MAKKKQSRTGLAIHGGAGTILKKNLSADLESAYRTSLLNIIEHCYDLLQSGSSALDVVEKAVTMLEDDPRFNAGKGSVFNENGGHEMDASIMNGKNLNAGAVSMIKKVKNPIMLARKIMENSDHLYLSGDAAEKFALKHNLEIKNKKYFHTDLRFGQLKKAKLKKIVTIDHSILNNEKNKFGTVGAVALDVNGNLASATSSGGMTNKASGRIGDSAIIGAGTYADNRTCAVSSTGYGEFFIRGVIAHDISCLMKYKKLSLRKACEYSIKKNLYSLGGRGGVIAIDKNCNIEIVFDTVGMYRACMKNGSIPEVRIFKN
jgi:L-asparaginase / beta-aspartyl-peptidase